MKPTRLFHVKHARRGRCGPRPISSTARQLPRPGDAAGPGRPAQRAGALRRTPPPGRSATGRDPRPRGGQPEGRGRQDDVDRERRRRRWPSWGSACSSIDLDPQGNASTALGVDHHRGVPSTYDMLVEGQPLADVMTECADLPGLWVVPATIDLAGAEIELVSVVAREQRLRGRHQRASARRDGRGGRVRTGSTTCWWTVRPRSAC